MRKAEQNSAIAEEKQPSGIQLTFVERTPLKAMEARKRLGLSLSLTGLQIKSGQQLARKVGPIIDDENKVILSAAKAESEMRHELVVAAYTARRDQLVAHFNQPPQPATAG